MKNTFQILPICTLFVFMTCPSPAGEKTGVLILAHGSKEKKWQEAVHEAAKPVKHNYPLEIAFGMADPATMQQGIDNLEALGVTRIVVVPLFISSHSPIIRQNEYLLGLRKKLADEPMVMDHSSAGHGNQHVALRMKAGLPVIKPLRLYTKVILCKPLDDNSLVVEIVEDRIRELSTEPWKETVILVAHGPNDEHDNEQWMKTIESIVGQIRARKKDPGESFRNIVGVTVRDDAKQKIQDHAREYLRSLVHESGKGGEVLVISLFLAQGGVEAKVAERLNGLKFKWSGKTLLPHVNISRFIAESIEASSRLP